MLKTEKPIAVLLLGLLIPSFFLFAGPSLKDLNLPASIPSQSEFYTIAMIGFYFMNQSSKQLLF